MIAEAQNPSFASWVDADELRQRDKRQATMSGSFSLGTTITSLPKLAGLPTLDVQIQCPAEAELRIVDVDMPKLGNAERIFRVIKQARLSAILLCVDNPSTLSDLTRVLAVTASASLSPNLANRIKSLADLRFDWDGEGAKSIKVHILADAVETLKRLGQRNPYFRDPFIAPTYGGFIQMEWHEQNRSLELEATDKGWSAVGSLAGATGERQYFTAEFGRNDFAQIEMLYQWLSGSDMIWPLM